MGEHTAELYWSCEAKLLISDPRQDYPFSINKILEYFFLQNYFPALQWMSCAECNFHESWGYWFCPLVRESQMVAMSFLTPHQIINFIFLFRHLARYQVQQWNKKISSIVKECCFIFYFRELWIIAMFQLHKTKPILDIEYAMRKLIICFVTTILHKLAFVLQNFKE